MEHYRGTTGALQLSPKFADVGGIREGSSKRSGRSNSCLKALKADEKGPQKGPEGPEKVKGQKLEGEGPVVLLMTTNCLPALQKALLLLHSTTASTTIALCSAVQYTIVLCSTVQYYTEHRGIYQYYRHYGHYGHSHSATVVL
jgi:hypothetical protein